MRSSICAPIALAVLIAATCAHSLEASVIKSSKYKISGINARLVGQDDPVTVKFDGKAESVGRMMVSESQTDVADGTWIDFSFQLKDPLDGLSGNPDGQWKVNLTDLKMSEQTPVFTSWYMYFTRDGKPVDFNPAASNKSLIGAHPLDSSIEVWSGVPLPNPDLPDGAENGLVFYNQQFSWFHHRRGLGVPSGVDGFHLGCKMEPVPEPSALVLLSLAVPAAVVAIRKRRSLHKGDAC
jgi:hypothetical protein